MTRPLHRLAPAAALLSAVAWLWIQRREIDTLTAANAGLHAAIAEARAAETSAEPRPLLAPLPTKLPDVRTTVRDFANLYSRTISGETDLRLANECNLAIARFTREDCEAALEELRKLDLTDRIVHLTSMMMYTRMLEVAPDFYFEHFLKLYEHRESSKPPPGWVFGKWADRDPVAASAWLDKALGTDMFANKRLDGQYDKRVEFETPLIRSMLADHPAEAEARLTKITPDQREDVFIALLKHCQEDRKDAVRSMIGRLISDPDVRERIEQTAEGGDR